MVASEGREEERFFIANGGHHRTILFDVLNMNF